MTTTTAIVTGGSSGIGRATAIALAAAGVGVVVVGRSQERVHDVVAEIERSSPAVPPLGLALDVRDEDDMERMAHLALDRHRRIDVLVACAGVGGGLSDGRVVPDPVSQMTTAEWDETVDTNLKGVFLSNRAVLPSMMEQGQGSIINVSSYPGGLNGQPFAAAYCASKAAVIGLSDVLAEEVGDHGITVEVLLPDATDTPLLRKSTLAERRGPPMPPGRVADLILTMLELSDDAIVPHATIVPHRTGVKGG